MAELLEIEGALDRDVFEPFGAFEPYRTYNPDDWICQCGEVFENRSKLLELGSFYDPPCEVYEYEQCPTCGSRSICEAPEPTQPTIAVYVPDPGEDN